MIKISFYKSSDYITGFSVKGHSGYADEGSDIVCSAVSSAAFMTVNTLTDVCKADADVFVSDDPENPLISLKLNSNFEKYRDIMQGFFIHIESLAEDYPKYIKLRSVTNA